MPVLGPLLLLAAILIVLLWALSLGVNLIGLILMLIVAGLIGLVADAIVPGEIPFGWVGAVATGLLGSWLGVVLIGRVGPELFGLPIIPALVGAVVVALAYTLIVRAISRPAA